LKLRIRIRALVAFPSFPILLAGYFFLASTHRHIQGVIEKTEILSVCGVDRI
jgi:hypothetical protein